jgi:two-component system, chemotaxis family, protein-glutamate methylesterase/glutaminase
VTRVLLVDDSVLARRLIARMLNVVEGLEVVGEASDPYVARERIAELAPDVVVLDVEMPRMDGISFLKRLMQQCPLPVVACSSVTARGGETALRALAAGALAVVSKPSDQHGPDEMARELVAAVLSAASVTPPGIAAALSPTLPPKGSLRPSALPTVLPRAARATETREIRAIGLGASTGGTVAVESIVKKLPGDSPPVLVVQHLPAYVVPAFATRLAQLTALRVEIASEGTLLRPGLLVLAPGNLHLSVERAGGELRMRLSQAEKLNGHRPAVDVLFQSLAETARADALGVLLTGMGKDGAQGLLAMREAGARTLVQDEASSVAWGMPKAAFELGAAEQVLPLDRIPARINQFTQRSSPLSLAPRSAAHSSEKGGA